MRIFFGLFVVVAVLNGGVFDFWRLDQAKKAYGEGNFTKAIDEFSKIDLKNDKAKYDLANSYYKAKDYKEAKELYTQIKDKSLEFEKLHNLGNTLANLGDIDGAIKSYEAALKIRDDKDTKFNLELLKKRKKEQEKKKKQNKQNKQNKDKKKNEDNKKSKDNKDKQNKNKKNNKDKKGKQNRKKDKDKKSNKKDKPNDKKDSKKRDKQNKSSKPKDKKEDKKIDQKRQQGNKEDKKRKKEMNKADKKELKEMAKQMPISDKEVKKYQKMLDKRGINTLLVPLQTKGGKDEELNNW